jgi:lysophospholipase L1-like esterase
LARLAWPVVAVFVLANALFLAAVAATRLLERPVDIQTRPTYRLRVDSFFARREGEGQRAVMLGDSLVFGGHLAERNGAGWHSLALPAQFERVGRARRAGGFTTLNLGIDGLLYGDLRCVVDDILERAPDVLVLNLSPRPFSGDFAKGGGESARRFLCPATPHGAFGAAGAAIDELAYHLLPAYRYRDLLQFQVLGATPRAFAASATLRVLGTLGRPADGDEADAEGGEDGEEATVLAEMMQRLRAAQRYNSIEVSSSHPQARELDRLLGRLHAERRTRVLVFYLKENIDVIAAQLDLPRYVETTRRFVERVQSGLAGAPRTRFLVIDAGDFAGQYVDHIHLTPAGYARLAGRLFEALPP